MFLGPMYDLIWSACALVAVGLTLAALVVWFRTRWEQAWEAVLTLLVIVLVPVIGPAAFLASRGRRQVPVRVRSADRRG
jgi:NhaP-type Na+/H+ or K+/H+ antiporter